MFKALTNHFISFHILPISPNGQVSVRAEMVLQIATICRSIHPQTTRPIKNDYRNAFALARPQK